MKRIWWLGLLCAVLWVSVVQAQPDLPTRLHPHQVFLQTNTGSFSSSRLLMIDLLTGEERSLDIYGERYTVTPAGVLFFSPADNRVKVVDVTGQVTDHPFIQPGVNTRRIDWVLDRDAQMIAWTSTEGLPGVLTTVTRVAGFDGSDAHEVLVDGPRDGVRALPVAFSRDRIRLYMDYQPDSVGDFTTFRQYAGLFALDLDSGTTSLLPDEPGCFCGAGLGSDWFLRLALSATSAGFELRAYHLERGLETSVSSLGLDQFTQGGDILISPDGAYAVYALAQVRNFGTANQEVETALVQVDLSTLSQEVVRQSIDFLLRPVAWTEDDSAVILTSPQRPGTWKLVLETGALEQIAAATYLGTIRPSA